MQCLSVDCIIVMLPWLCIDWRARCINELYYCNAVLFLCRVCSSRRCGSGVVLAAPDVVSQVCPAEMTRSLGLWVPALVARVVGGRSLLSRFPTPALDRCLCLWTHAAVATRACGWCRSYSGCSTLDKCLILPTTDLRLGVLACFSVPCHHHHYHGGI